MRAGTFYFNNRFSEDFDVFIQNRPKRKTPVRRNNTFTVSGKSGLVNHKKQTYDNTELELNLFFKQSESSDYRLDDIAEWLDTESYVDFIPYYDETHVYKVLVNDVSEFTSNIGLRNIVTFTVTLSVYPFKYPVSALDDQAFSDYVSITNISKYRAEPRITIYGYGDIYLKVNDEIFDFVEVDKSITIDTEQKLILDHDLNEAPKKAKQLQFPYLVAGDNQLYTNGSEIVLIPRFVRRAV